MPKAQGKSVEEEENDIPLHGPINEAEAKEYASSLDNIVIKMGQDVKDETQDTMKNAIMAYKDEIYRMISGMDSANHDAVWRSIKDKVGLCIQPQSDEVETQLDFITPSEEIPTAGEVLKRLEKPDQLTQEDRDLIREVFDSLELVHAELASTCSTLSRLAHNLHPKNPITVLKASIRPLIQMKPTTLLLEADATSTSRNPPDDPKERIEKLMIPDLESRLI